MIIASSPSAFLVVILDGFADRIVNHKTNVRFVDTHSKCYGGHNNLKITNGVNPNHLHLVKAERMLSYLFELDRFNNFISFSKMSSSKPIQS